MLLREGQDQVSAGSKCEIQGKENHGIACCECARDIKISVVSCVDFKCEQMLYFGERNTSNAMRSIQVLAVLKWQLN